MPAVFEGSKVVNGVSGRWKHRNHMVVEGGGEWMPVYVGNYKDYGFLS